MDESSDKKFLSKMKNLEFDHLIRELKKSNAPLVIFGAKK